MSPVPLKNMSKTKNEVSIWDFVTTKISQKSQCSRGSKICTQFDFDWNRLKFERSPVGYHTNEISKCAGRNMICRKYWISLFFVIQMSRLDTNDREIHDFEIEMSFFQNLNLTKYFLSSSWSSLSLIIEIHSSVERKRRI